MKQTRRATRWLALLAMTTLASCSSCGEDEPAKNNANNTPTPDMGAGDMNPRPDMNVRPDMNPRPDMGQDMADMNAQPDMEQPNAQVITCPTPVAPAPNGQLCAVTPGNNTALVIRGTILTKDAIYRQGAIVIDRSGKNGQIAYVGCDAEAQALAQGATRFECAQGVVSPGLINAHDHITFNSKGSPKPHGEERFDHRHDWRTGARGHTRVPSDGSSSAREHVLFGELRHILAGSTSIAGSGGADGFTRNLDRANQEGLPGNVRVRYDTFPLGDSNGTLVAEGCSRYEIPSADVLQNTIWLPHVAEGIDPEARNEFSCLAGAAGVDLIRGNTSLIHGIGLKASDIADLASDGGKLVWSPRSNIDLYGQTADVMTYDRLGVTIGLGTDWIISGSMNMLRELACADYLNREHYNNYFSDYQLWLMATANSAVTMGVQEHLGALEMGKIADIALFDGTVNKDHRAVIAATGADVALVLRGGQPLYGEATLIERLVTAADAAKCEALDICERPRRLCAELDTGLTLDALRRGAENPTYPLISCATPPPQEPTCVPSRPNEYAGGPMPNDRDGDGIPDNQDICPDVFNPKRPLDMNQQPDFDGDGLGDACDVCVFNGGMPCEPYNANDTDGDGVPNPMDNCPFVANPNQEDRDRDGIGDACDKCPDFANPNGQGCLQTVYDIKTRQVAIGERVKLRDVVVTGSGTDGFFLQVIPGSPSYNGVDHSGVFVFARALMNKPPAGAVIELDATVSEFQSQVQLQDIQADGITLVSQGEPPAPVAVSKTEILRAGAKGQVLEGVLVRVEDVSVTSINAQFGEYVLDNGLVMDDILYAPMPALMVGDRLSALVGSISFRFGENRIAPRSQADLITGPPTLSELTPALTTLRAGTTGQPQPALIVRLTSAPSQDAVIALAYSDATVLTGPPSVTIPAGQSQAPLTLQGVAASDSPQTLTATYDGKSVTSQVRVYDDASTRALASLTPASQTLAPGAMGTLTLTLTLPAAQTGTQVALSATGGLVVPAMVTVPAGQLSVDVPLTAPAMAGMSTVTATLGASTQQADVTVNALPSECLIISEYVEGSSNNKAVEIYNCGSSALDLSQFGMCAFQNAGTACQSEVTLSGMLPVNGTYVICNSSAEQAIKDKCQLQNNSIANFNGDDRLLIYKGSPSSPVDAFGELTMRPGSTIWADRTLDRCDFTPYLGVGAFDYTTRYRELPNNTFTGLGVAPTMGCP